jgi:hypothetical protein
MDMFELYSKVKDERSSKTIKSIIRQALIDELQEEEQQIKEELYISIRLNSNKKYSFYDCNY